MRYFKEGNFIFICKVVLCILYFYCAFIIESAQIEKEENYLKSSNYTNNEIYKEKETCRNSVSRYNPYSKRTSQIQKETLNYNNYSEPYSINEPTYEKFNYSEAHGNNIGSEDIIRFSRPYNIYNESIQNAFEKIEQTPSNTSVYCGSNYATSGLDLSSYSSHLTEPSVDPEPYDNTNIEYIFNNEGVSKVPIYNEVSEDTMINQIKQALLMELEEPTDISYMTQPLINPEYDSNNIEYIFNNEDTLKASTYNEESKDALINQIKESLLEGLDQSADISHVTSYSTYCEHDQIIEFILNNEDISKVSTDNKLSEDTRINQIKHSLLDGMEQLTNIVDEIKTSSNPEHNYYTNIESISDDEKPLTNLTHNIDSNHLCNCNKDKFTLENTSTESIIEDQGGTENTSEKGDSLCLSDKSHFFSNFRLRKEGTNKESDEEITSCDESDEETISCDESDEETISCDESDKKTISEHDLASSSRKLDYVSAFSRIVSIFPIIKEKIQNSKTDSGTSAKLIVNQLCAIFPFELEPIKSFILAYGENTGNGHIMPLSKIIKELYNDSTEDTYRSDIMKILDTRICTQVYFELILNYCGSYVKKLKNSLKDSLILKKKSFPSSVKKSFELPRNVNELQSIFSILKITLPEKNAINDLRYFYLTVLQMKNKSPTGINMYMSYPIDSLLSDIVDIYKSLEMRKGTWKKVHNKQVKLLIDKYEYDEKNGYIKKIRMLIDMMEKDQIELKTKIKARLKDPKIICNYISYHLSFLLLHRFISSQYRAGDNSKCLKIYKAFIKTIDRVFLNSDIPLDLADLLDDEQSFISAEEEPLQFIMTYLYLGIIKRVLITANETGINYYRSLIKVRDGGDKFIRKNFFESNWDYYHKTIYTINIIKNFIIHIQKRKGIIETVLKVYKIQDRINMKIARVSSMLKDVGIGNEIKYVTYDTFAKICNKFDQICSMLCELEEILENDLLND